MGVKVSAGRDIGKVIVIEGNQGTITFGPDMSQNSFSDELRKLDAEIAAMDELSPEAKEAARKDVAEAIVEAESEQPIGKLIARKLMSAADAVKKAGDVTGGATKIFEAIVKIATFAATAAIFGG